MYHISFWAIFIIYFNYSDIYLMADYYLNKSIEEQCRAFVSGFQVFLIIKLVYLLLLIFIVNERKSYHMNGRAFLAQRKSNKSSQAILLRQSTLMVSLFDTFNFFLKKHLICKIWNGTRSIMVILRPPRSSVIFGELCVNWILKNRKNLSSLLQGILLFHLYYFSFRFLRFSFFLIFEIFFLFRSNHYFEMNRMYPKPPLMGFGALRPELSIRKVEEEGGSVGGLLAYLPVSIGGGDVNRLPSASVCFNTLKLPHYKKQSTLKEKLLYAINSATGFELSWVGICCYCCCLFVCTINVI